jgi:diadenosine tetraphosphate (Ap4A) HIT family hydrolase
MSEYPFCAVGERKWLENEAAIAFPDAYPLAEGHTLVAPRLHVSSLYEHNPDQQSSVWELVVEVRQRLLVGLKPDAFNIGVNDGLPQAKHSIMPMCTSFPDAGVTWPTLVVESVGSG